MYGRSDVTVETDHLPLVRLFEKPLHQVPLHLQKNATKFVTLYVQTNRKVGKRHASRRRVEPRILARYVQRAHGQLKETKQDQSLQKLAQVVRTSRPEHRAQLEPEVCVYFDTQEEISKVDRILFKGERVIIPESMRKEMLQLMHESHMGMVHCKQLARDIMYWPGMNTQIEDIVSKCHICQTHRNQQPKEAMKSSEIPTAPWSILAADVLDCDGVMYLVVIPRG